MDDLEKEMKRISQFLRKDREIVARMNSNFKDLPDKEKKDIWPIVKKFKDLIHRDKEIAENIDKGNREEALRHFRAMIEQHKNFDYQSFYDAVVKFGLLDESEAEVVLKNEKMIESLEEGFIQEINAEAEASSEKAHRPVIMVDEELFREFLKDINSIQVNEGDEFAGFFDYERTEEGLKLLDYSIMSEDEAARSSYSVSFSDSAVEKMESNTSNKTIPFHTHPSRAGIRPSENDTFNAHNWKTGIEIIGYEAPEFMSSEGPGMAAFTINLRQEINSFLLLPVIILSEGQNVTQKYPQMSVYNKMLKGREEYRYKPEVTPLDCLKEIWRSKE